MDKHGFKKKVDELKGKKLCYLCNKEMYLESFQQSEKGIGYPCSECKQVFFYTKFV